jgi:hypothetical protein
MTIIFFLLLIIISLSILIFILNSFIKLKLKKRLSESEQPFTVNIFKGITFIAIALLLSELITTFNTLTKVLPSQISNNDLLLKEVSYYCIYLGISLVVFAFIFWLSTLLLSVINKGENIFIEVANNNFESLILFAAILFALIFTVKTGITPLLDNFIPYPEMPIYR